jgi:deoxyribonuclease-4
MWRACVPDPEQVKLFQAARERFGLHPLAIHANYLINLATADPVIRAKSVAGFRGELDRAALIGADYLVLHPGSYRGRTVEEGISSFVSAIAEASQGFNGNVIVLIENTAGCGAQVGSRLEELRSIRERAADHTDLPIGYCLDTCHLLAAGFDISTHSGLRATVRGIAQHLGFQHVHMLHANDSKASLGSRVDRHASIGKGHIGQEGFRRILTHPDLREKPFILETPVESEGDDRRNLDTLKRLARHTARNRAAVRKRA